MNTRLATAAGVTFSRFSAPNFSLINVYPSGRTFLRRMRGSVRQVQVSRAWINSERLHPGKGLACSKRMGYYFSTDPALIPFIVHSDEAAGG
jgi:hypothetical protein